MDHAVALAEAYLRVNGYFTVTEYPVVVIAAQHPEHNPAQPTPKAESKAAKPGAMMTLHQEMHTFVDQLIQSFTALEQEKDPEVLKKKMAEHRALLQQLQSKLKQCSETMGKMRKHMKKCPMLRSEEKQN